MTYSVIGRCSRTGKTGLGISTYSIACGSFAQGAHGGAGIAMTQANVRKANNPLANQLLRDGYSPEHVLALLRADDAESEYRQLAVMSRDGRIAAWTGSKVRPWCGEKIGADYVVFGNGLAGKHVAEAMAKAFEANADTELEERLLRTLEAGQAAGGQGFNSPKKAERSASIAVVNERNYTDWDLRVDLHQDAIAELRRVYEAFKPYQAFYNERDRAPSECLAQDAWERKNLPQPAF